MDSGKQYVIMYLVLLMLKLFANNCDLTVTIIMITSKIIINEYKIISGKINISNICFISDLVIPVN